MACSLASRSSRFAAALRADLDAISARHPKDPAVGTKSWLQSNKKLNVYLDTPNPHVSNPDSHRGKILDCSHGECVCQGWAATFLFDCGHLFVPTAGCAGWRAQSKSRPAPWGRRAAAWP